MKKTKTCNFKRKINQLAIEKLGQEQYNKRLKRIKQQFEYWDVERTGFLNEEYTFRLLKNVGKDLSIRKECEKVEFKKLVRTIVLRYDNYFSLDEFIKLSLKAVILNK